MLEKQSEVIRQIIWLRLAQIMVNERYKEGAFKIPIHLAMGHESLAVAVDRVLADSDALVLTHRNIHYNLARLGTLREELDEFYLLEAGVGQGRLGSMNLANPRKNIVYTSSVLGNDLPVASGFALGNKAKKNDGVVFVVTGDGALEEGAFYESLLFMKSNQLNTVVLVENNEWSLGTRIEERRSPIDLDKLTSALGIDYISLRDNDPFEYIEKLQRCREDSLEKNSPVLAEVYLTTLGYWYMETEEYPEGKFINYHAGPAPEVEIKDYPLLNEGKNDPIFAIGQYVSEEEIRMIATDIIKQLEVEM
jgi:TPP-dependent pyruvate/acetoin dehydrogenase alpha subunit